MHASVHWIFCNLFFNPPPCIYLLNLLRTRVAFCLRIESSLSMINSHKIHSTEALTGLDLTTTGLCLAARARGFTSFIICFFKGLKMSLASTCFTSLEHNPKVVQACWGSAFNQRKFTSYTVFFEFDSMTCRCLLCIGDNLTTFFNLTTRNKNSHDFSFLYTN